MKKNLQNSDGGNDLVTVVTLAHQDVNKTLILAVLKKIMDKYFEFRRDLIHSLEGAPVAAGDPSSPTHEHLAKAKLGEFKLYMTQIIKFEEMLYDSNLRIYSYGSTDQLNNDDGVLTPRSDVITPNQLIAANEEVGEVRLLMLDNITKLLSRGDKINSLVDQTERLQVLSLVFNKGAQTIRRNMWLSNAKFFLSLIAIGLVLLYMVVGFECGYPFFQVCFRH